MKKLEITNFMNHRKISNNIKQKVFKLLDFAENDKSMLNF